MSAHSASSVSCKIRDACDAGTLRRDDASSARMASSKSSFSMT
jgi:hypothetical protein